MKIIVITPANTGKYKDDTTLFIEEFEKLGHKVIKAPLITDNEKISAFEPFDVETLKGADVIWAPYEPLIPIAIWIRENYGGKVCGHFEAVPFNRINLDSITDYWIRNITDEGLKSNKYYQDYRKFIDSYTKCDLKTIIDQWSLNNMERLIGRKFTEPMYIKPYPFDNEMLEQHKDDTIKEKYQIISVMRAVPHKRIHHIIKALSMLDNPPKYIVVGTGPEIDNLKKLAELLEVDVEFKGLISDEEKCKLIQESMFGVYLWSWLPIADCAYYNKPSIVYDHIDTRNKIRDMAYYTNNNDIPMLAKSIEYLCNHEEERKELGKKANTHLLNQYSDIIDKKSAAKRMLTLLEMATK